VKLDTERKLYLTEAILICVFSTIAWVIIGKFIDQYIDKFDSLIIMPFLIIKAIFAIISGLSFAAIIFYMFGSILEKKLSK